MLRRLSCAVDDLAQDKLSITEISSKYGYETVESFSKAFKRLFNYSPSKYLKTNSLSQIYKLENRLG